MHLVQSKSKQNWDWGKAKCYIICVSGGGKAKKSSLMVDATGYHAHPYILSTIPYLVIIRSTKEMKF